MAPGARLPHNAGMLIPGALLVIRSNKIKIPLSVRQHKERITSEVGSLFITEQYKYTTSMKFTQNGGGIFV